MQAFSPCLVFLGLFTLLAPLCSAATCNDQSISDGSSKDEIAAYLTNILNLQGGTTCSDTWPPVGPLEVTVNANNMFLHRSKTSADIALTWCHEAFSNIISQCVLKESKWGGSWELDGQSFTITNNVYPANGIVVPGTSNPTTSQAVDYQPGPFTTGYISGITANTVTTTQLSDQSSSTVLPVWFCLKCDVVAAGIFLIPLAAPVAGALIPPPPGFPPLTIGPNGSPTPTGDPAPGNQPTGDPRPTTKKDGSSSSTTKTSSSSSTTTSTTTTSTSSSTTTSSETSTSSGAVACPNEKRADTPKVIRSVKREIVYIRGVIVKRAEEEKLAANPLREALEALGGPDVLLQSTGLKLITNKMPKQVIDQKGQQVINQVLNAYVTGLEARAASTLQITVAGIKKKTLKQGDLFRIRWDWDKISTDDQGNKKGKGVHINAEFGSSDMYKVAFVPQGWKISPDDPTTYEKVVSGQSSKLNYNSQPAPPNSKLSPEERTGKQGQQDPQKALQDMAKELAQIWKQQYEDCSKNGEPS